MFIRVNPALVDRFGLEKVAQIAQAFRAKAQEEAPLDERTGLAVILSREFGGVKIVGWRRVFQDGPRRIDAVQLDSEERFQNQNVA